MFAHGQHFDATRDLGGLFDQRGNGRHITVFHRDPQRGRIILGKRRNNGRIGGIRVQRLFTQDRDRADRRNFLQLCDVQIVRAHDDHRIDILRHQISNRRGNISILRKRRRRLGQLIDRIEHGRHAPMGQQVDILDMLAPHHAAADQTVVYIFQHY